MSAEPQPSVPLQALFRRYGMSRTVGLAFSGAIGLMAARRLTQGNTGGLLFFGDRMFSNLMRNPIVVSAVMQPFTAPVVGGDALFDVRLDYVHNAGLVTVNVEGIVSFDAGASDAVVATMVREDSGSHNLFPADSIPGGAGFGLSVTRVGSDARDTLDADLLFVETLFVDFTQFYVC